MEITLDWIEANSVHAEQIIPANGLRIENPIKRFETLIRDLAINFSKERYGEIVELRYGKRGLHPDDTAAFIRAVDGGHIQLNENGSFVPLGCRSKPGGCLYSLFTENRWNDDFYISLNTENLIHFGAAAELHESWGWDKQKIEVEVGEFDARVWGEDRAVLLMEAKARISDQDGLAPLLRSFIKYADGPEPPKAVDNHSRKYVELLKRAESGPVILWLVAAGARWAFTASRVEDHIELQEINGPWSEDHTVGHLEQEEKGLKIEDIKPLHEHAIATALLTELDTRQRAYEHPWKDKDEIYEFIKPLKSAMKAEGMAHTQSWVWAAATSGGSALTPCGKDCGLELRFSYSPKSQ
jgi:hypothetical protein